MCKPNRSTSIKLSKVTWDDRRKGRGDVFKSCSLRRQSAAAEYSYPPVCFLSCCTIACSYVLLGVLLNFCEGCHYGKFYFRGKLDSFLLRLEGTPRWSPLIHPAFMRLERRYANVLIAQLAAVCKDTINNLIIWFRRNLTRRKLRASCIKEKNLSVIKFSTEIFFFFHFASNSG